jgi:hypothetical protein
MKKLHCFIVFHCSYFCSFMIYDLLYKMAFWLFFCFCCHHSQVPEKVDLWSESSGLGIFNMDRLAEFQSGPRLSTWSNLHAKELKLSVTHPPSNIFEQMILWTDQGKLWHFPINNEQGKDIVFFLNQINPF